MSKFQNLSKEELLKLVEKQEKELESKRYGLVWDSEREPEQVVLDCANNLPVLKRVKGKEIKIDDSEDNILIEGDNYHALTVLNYTHKGKIDVIYIDPPYNTGAKDWKYNNNYIDSEDGFRHSKWINMMDKRLRLARTLLTEVGIIAIAIDHYELFNLGLLCDNIFDEKNRLGIINVLHKPEGRQFAKFCSYTNEYFFLYSKNIAKAKFNTVVLDSKIDFTFDRLDKKGKYRLKNFIRFGGGDISLKINKPKGFYPIYVDPKNFKNIILEYNPKFIKLLPIKNNGQERTWNTYQDTFLNNLNNNNILVEKDKQGRIQIYEKYRKEEKGQVIKTTWIDTKYNAINYGTNLLSSIIGKEKFNFPKSLYLILDILKITSKKESTILDFFAGSGTTGHAVLELNKKDGGNRKFILCTNNEELDSNGDIKKHRICTDVTYPRIEKVIKGYKKNENGEKVEGLGGNIQYFKTFLIKKTKNQDQVKVNLTQKCTEMLCVKENIFNLEKEGQDYKIFFSNKKDKFLCVYYNFLDDSFDEFLKEIKKLKGKKIIYMFSIDNKVDKSLFASVDNFTIEAIPQKILDVYKQLVKMNIPVKTDIIFLELSKAKVEIFDEKEKDAGARRLRIVLEKLIQKVAQNNGINILSSKGKEEKISTLNDKLKHDKIFTHIEWEENRTYLTIGNYASHGDNDEYNMEQVENFYKHIQSLLNNFNI